tara:strand:+ start:589 stop:1125 length:537 start_codon:yes stop_codon:yes gene_type:complete
VVDLSLYNKLTGKQVKNLTSADLMKLGQLTFVDAESAATLNQLNSIKGHVNNLVTQGASVFADSLKFGSQTANAGAVNFKPSTIYDSEQFANTYLVQILGISATVASSTATLALQLTDGSNTFMLQKPTNVTASGPLTFLPTDPIYINESNYLTITNSESVNCVVVVYCAIVARGGAE